MSRFSFCISSFGALWCVVNDIVLVPPDMLHTGVTINCGSFSPVKAIFICMVPPPIFYAVICDALVNGKCISEAPLMINWMSRTSSLGKLTFHHPHSTAWLLAVIWSETQGSPYHGLNNLLVLAAIIFHGDGAPTQKKEMGEGRGGFGCEILWKMQRGDTENMDPRKEEAISRWQTVGSASVLLGKLGWLW